MAWKQKAIIKIKAKQNAKQPNMENKIAEEEGSIKSGRFVEVETQDLDAFVEDSQA